MFKLPASSKSKFNTFDNHPGEDKWGQMRTHKGGQNNGVKMSNVQPKANHLDWRDMNPVCSVLISLWWEHSLVTSSILVHQWNWISIQHTSMYRKLRNYVYIHNDLQIGRTCQTAFTTTSRLLSSVSSSVHMSLHYCYCKLLIFLKAAPMMIMMILTASSCHHCKSINVLH